MENDVFSLYLKVNEKQILEMHERYVNSLKDTFQLQEYLEDGQLKGYIFYKKENDTLIIIEVGFFTGNKWALIREVSKIAKGMKKIIWRTSNTNNPMMKLGKKYLKTNYDEHTKLFVYERGK